MSDETIQKLIREVRRTDRIADLTKSLLEELSVEEIYHLADDTLRLKLYLVLHMRNPNAQKTQPDLPDLMWRPVLGSLVTIRPPSNHQMFQTSNPTKFRVVAVTDYQDGGIEAKLQPEHEDYPHDTTHSLYTSWLVPA